MINRLSMNQGALGVIIIALSFIALFFLVQVVVPIILKIIRKTHKIAYTGQELVDLLVEDGNLKDCQVNPVTKKITSPYFAYNRQTKNLSLTNNLLESFSLDTVFQVFTSLTFASEKRHKIFSFSWQLWIINLLSVLPYIFGLTILLVIYLPDPEVFKNIAGSAYYLTAEALGIACFVTIIIIAIWWSYALQPIELEFENYLKKINNKSLTNVVMHHFKLCSYLPFSWRLLI